MWLFFLFSDFLYCGLPVSRKQCFSFYDLSVCSGENWNKACVKITFYRGFSKREETVIWFNMIKPLTHWVKITHMRQQTNYPSDNGLSPGLCQAIICTNAGILLIGPLGTNFSEIFIIIQTFSLTKMHLKMSSAKWVPFCLGLNVLRTDSCKHGSINSRSAWLVITGAL